MDVRDLITGVVRGTSDLSAQSVQISLSDLLVAGALVTAIILILLTLVFILKMKAGRPVADPSVQLVAGLRGKLEKLEMALNQLKTERARAKEFYRVEFEYLRRELSQLKESFSDGKTQPQDIPAPPTSEDSIDVRELDRLHDSVLEQDDDLEFETVEEAETPSLSGESADDTPVEMTESVIEEAEEPVSQTEEAGVADGVPLPAGGQFSEAIEEARGEDMSLSSRLEKTRSGFFGKLKELFVRKAELDAETAEELEALLVSCDLGVKTVEHLMQSINDELQKRGQIPEEELLSLLSAQIEAILKADVPEESRIQIEKKADGPLVVLVVGVNGVGKTTTVAKLASRWKADGKRVLMVAADTFRAAAVEQLQSWGERLDVPVVSGAPDAKPTTVVFDGMKRAQDEDFDVLLIDTAGRLHNKSNLMQELEGVRNAIVRHQPTAPHETILVVDGATGQNALQQAREFNQAVLLTGIIVTKLDGSPRGGIVVAIKEELGVPVRYIGVGEAQEDLRPFVAADFAEALFDTSGLNGHTAGSNEESVSAHGEKRRRRRETTWTI